MAVELHVYGTIRRFWQGSQTPTLIGARNIPLANKRFTKTTKPRLRRQHRGPCVAAEAGLFTLKPGYAHGERHGVLTVIPG